MLSLTCVSHGQIMSILSRKSQIPWYFRSPPHSSRIRPGMAKHVTRTLVAYGCTWSLVRITVHVHYTPLEIPSKPSAKSTTKCLEKIVLSVSGAFSFMDVKGIRTRILEYYYLEHYVFQSEPDKCRYWPNSPANEEWQILGESQ